MCALLWYFVLSILLFFNEKYTTAVFLIAILLTCEITFYDSTKCHGQLNHKEGLFSSKPHTSQISSLHTTAVGFTAGSWLTVHDTYFPVILFITNGMSLCSVQGVWTSSLCIANSSGSWVSGHKKHTLASVQRLCAQAMPSWSGLRHMAWGCWTITQAFCEGSGTEASVLWHCF